MYLQPRIYKSLQLCHENWYSWISISTRLFNIRWDENMYNEMVNTIWKLPKGTLEIDTQTQFSVLNNEKQKVISGQTYSQPCSPLTFRHLYLLNSVSEHAQSCWACTATYHEHQEQVGCLCMYATSSTISGLLQLAVRLPKSRPFLNIMNIIKMMSTPDSMQPPPKKI
jgi:hypothetical protein